jgi:hypothetical protein
MDSMDMQDESELQIAYRIYKYTLWDLKGPFASASKNVPVPPKLKKNQIRFVQGLGRNFLKNEVQT